MAQVQQEQRQAAAVARILACKSTDYYGILGLTKISQRTQYNIRNNYRRFSLQIHPDKNTAPEATTASQLLNSAYERLNTPEKQKLYDGGMLYEREDEDEKTDEKKVEEEENSEEEMARIFAAIYAINLLHAAIMLTEDIWYIYYNEVYDTEETNRRRQQQQQPEPQSQSQSPTEAILKAARKRGYIDGFKMFMSELITRSLWFDGTVVFIVSLLFAILLSIIILDVSILSQVWTGFFLNLGFPREVSSNLTPPLIIEILIKVIPAEKVIVHYALYFFASWVWGKSLLCIRPLAEDLGEDYFFKNE